MIFLRFSYDFPLRQLSYLDMKGEPVVGEIRAATPWLLYSQTSQFVVPMLHAPFFLLDVSGRNKTPDPPGFFSKIWAKYGGNVFK